MAASFNKIILVGTMVRDPQVKYTTGGTAVTEIGLAINRKWKDTKTDQWKEDVTFVDITLWGRTAEIAGEYLVKGRSAMVEGRLQLDTWDDRESGQKRSKLKVIGESLVLLGSKGEGGGKPSDESTRSQSNDSRGQQSTSEPTGDDVPF